jgi:hypothetical protein
MASGDTAVYDALDKARRMLAQCRPDLPNLRKRIIIVSDGEDTSSRNDPRNVCVALRRDKIIVDSVQVGEHHDTTLHAISVVTGTHHPLGPFLSLNLRDRWLSFLPKHIIRRCLVHLRESPT